MRLKPVPEGSPHHACIRARRAALHHEMFTIEEIRRISAIERKGLKSIQRTERRRGPFPSVPQEIQHAKCAGSCGMRINRTGIPSLMMEISMMVFRRRVAPWILLLRALRRAISSAMPLRFRRQFFIRPPRKRRRLRMAHINGPGLRKRHGSKHRAIIPLHRNIG